MHIDSMKHADLKAVIRSMMFGFTSVFHRVWSLCCP
uniref:Uncharacterized protein n=1 Tax=Arundo donax TaxID=35708 RepID=A0A0A9CM49_ARUDO